MTGLGLGCVLRGLLHRGQCRTITVIERDPSVIRLVWPSLREHTALTLVEADARAWVQDNTEQFDYVWHDIWNDSDKNEPALQVMHGEMMVALAQHATRQGAWAFPRMCKRHWPGIVG